MPENPQAVRTLARIAFSQIGSVSESEREQVLIALVELLPEGEAIHAEQALYHLREQRKAQLTLRAVLEGGAS
jgi:hypothetical protein